MQLNISSFRGLRSRKSLVWIPILTLVLAVLGCDISIGNSGSNSIGPTQTALAVQMTNIAVMASPTNGPTPIPITTKASVDFPATSAAMAAQLTALAQSTPQAAPQQAALDTSMPPPAQPTPAAPPEQPTPAAPPPSPVPARANEDFDTWKQNAAILVYEDIVTDPKEALYIKDTLHNMGLQNVKWDGNAMGWLKTDLLSSPNGKPWDLVIIASESRDDVSGEYFDYLSNVLGQGSSVILESWFLDDVSEGKVSPILAKCGVMVYPYVPKTGTVNDVVMYPLPGGAAHSVLNEPNSGLSFTQARDTWLWTFDLGSLMASTGQGDAQLLLGTSPNKAGEDVTLAVCMNGQLTLQTFSSHSFPSSVMTPLWENMIDNALRVRHQSGG
jgi:hypothetical protein